MIVHKYGGSSVATIEKIMDIAKNLEKLSKKEKIIVVVSAMGKTTNKLIELANQISCDNNKREMDRLLSTGENQTIALMSMALNYLGVKSVSLTAEQIKILTTSNYSKARILSIDKEKLEKYISKYDVLVVAGFQGVDEKGDVTTLGRGGSDTTAVALAAVLNCPCNIYTDVCGVYSIDPRIYEKATKIDKISYDIMSEFSYKGAGVMEPRSILLASKYNVELTVSKTLSKDRGTLITNKENVVESQNITGICINENTVMVTIDNIATYAKNLAPIFEKVKKLGINVDMISHNDVISDNGSIAFTSDLSDLPLIKKLVSNMGSVLINENVSKVTLVGVGISWHIGLISSIFKILEENNYSFHQISTSQISLTLVVDSKIAKDLAKKLAIEFKL